MQSICDTLNHDTLNHDTLNHDTLNNSLNNTVTVPPNKPSYVYLLLSTGNYTYVGATIDLNHRLRQHNKEIKGGAKITSARVEKGETWKRVVHVEGFPDWKAALQFEWRWKQLTRKVKKTNAKPIEKRLIALKQLLKLERPTSNAIKYSEWTNPPNVVFEDEKIRELY